MPLPALWHGLLAVCAAAWTGVTAPASAATKPQPDVTAAVPEFRYAFSAEVFRGINRADATAAILAWGREIVIGQSIKAKPTAHIFDDPEELFTKLQAGQLDGVTVLTDELLARPGDWLPENVHLSSCGGETFERYVLLVHRARGIAGPDDLREQTLDLHQGTRMALAPLWLDVFLAQQNLDPAENFFSHITHHDKASRAVLRVFFRQTDACLVTQRTFETMGELNPQVRQQLQILAISPELIPSLFFFRRDFVGSLRREIESTIRTVHETKGGQQAMTVFQSDRFVTMPASCLSTTRALYQEFVQLRNENGAATTTVDQADTSTQATRESAPPASE